MGRALCVGVTQPRWGKKKVRRVSLTQGSGVPQPWAVLCNPVGIVNINTRYRVLLNPVGIVNINTRYRVLCNPVGILNTSATLGRVIKSRWDIACIYTRLDCWIVVLNPVGILNTSATLGRVIKSRWDIEYRHSLFASTILCNTMRVMTRVQLENE